MNEKNNRSIESQLSEIREMLNIILTYTYISDTTTLQDLYSEIKKQQSELQVEEFKLLPQAELSDSEVKELLSHAYSTGKFKVDKEFMYIEKNEKVNKIPLSRIN